MMAIIDISGSNEHNKDGPVVKSVTENWYDALEKVMGLRHNESAVAKTAIRQSGATSKTEA